jgi:flagellar biosynthetic protein FlhB
MANDPSKTERATPRRINKARNEGNVKKSQEVTKVLTLVCGITGLFFWLRFIGDEMGALYRHFFSTAILTFNPVPSDVLALGAFIAKELAFMVLPVIVFIGFIAFVVIRVQVGKLWTTKVFKPKLSKFNPVNGFKRMFFSLDTWVRMGKSLLQAICIGITPWLLIKSEMHKFSDLYYTDAVGLAAYILNTGYRMVLYALVPMIAIAVFDFFYSRWQYSENLKMTKDEVKDERKQTEGDPRVKSKQRQKMMQMMSRRMMQEVPKADVIITNPTHLAIAIRYNALEAPAPVVLAKGADKVAEKIKEIARENKIPIRENKPLARALYRQVDIGDMIPEELYQAVAALLAQIWKTRPRKPQGPNLMPPKK